MNQLIFASLSNTHYWYEVGMLKVPAVERHRSMANKLKYIYMFFRIDRNHKLLGLLFPTHVQRDQQQSRRVIL